MCGIAGCTGVPDAGKFLINALKQLEYRGYDSAGMTLAGEKFYTVKTTGNTAGPEAKFLSAPVLSSAGIAHTRRATPGIPSEKNAHPHLRCKREISVVHNGILTNYPALKERLEKAGPRFRSETDSEMIPHLFESLYKGDPLKSVSAALEQLSGSFAIAGLPIVPQGHDPGMFSAFKSGNNSNCASAVCLLFCKRKGLFH